MKNNAIQLAKVVQYAATVIGLGGCGLLFQQAYATPAVPAFVTALACFGGLFGFFAAIYWQASLQVQNHHEKHSA